MGTDAVTPPRSRSPALAAVIQMTSGPEVAPNLEAAAEQLAAAADAGATLAVLPENFACLPRREPDRLAMAEADGDGPIQAFLADQAATHGLWIVGGTIPLSASPGRVKASCLVYDEAGQRVARYDKIHLFDVAVPGADEAYRESDSIAPGDSTVVVESPLGRLGLAICYDLRFPELFRRLAADEAQVVALPSAFTVTTGRAHWDVLVRARAVENLSWVLAAGQHGRHPNGRETWGHSMIVDPWGRVVARLPEGAGIVTAEVDLALVAGLRRDFPVLTHRRLSG
jgi:predicted amidohydrolase